MGCRMKLAVTCHQPPAVNCMEAIQSTNRQPVDWRWWRNISPVNWKFPPGDWLHAALTNLIVTPARNSLVKQLVPGTNYKTKITQN